MGDKALPSGLVLYPPYVPIGHDVCNTYTVCICTVHVHCTCTYMYVHVYNAVSHVSIERSLHNSYCLIFTSTCTYIHVHVHHNLPPSLPLPLPSLKPTPHSGNTVSKLTLMHFSRPLFSSYQDQSCCLRYTAPPYPLASCEVPLSSYEPV